MTLQLSRQEAASELLRRRRIRGSLEALAVECGFVPAAHHQLVIEALERIERTPNGRLGIFLPPGSAKSTFASVLFPASYLARNPDKHVLAASHTVELAEKFGRRVRNLISEYGLTLGLQIAGDNQAAGRWALSTGGEYYAAGVGVGIAGFRADLVVIDDPIRSREDADSERVRNRIWDWYLTDLRTRLKPGGRIVLIQTRWHEDDLAGRIAAEMERGGEQWELLSIPAESDGAGDPLGRPAGGFLWGDDDYGYADRLRAEKEILCRADPRTWSALYQQRPAPESGDFFKAEWLRTVPNLPPVETMRIYGASDYAVTSNGGDYTVHAVLGMASDGRLFLLDIWRGQASSDQWVEAFCDLAAKWRPLEWAEETGQIKSGVGPFLERRMRERRVYVGRQQFPTRGDKAQRAQSIRAFMALNGLHVLGSAPFLADLRAELMAFPAGKHDDQVDALGLVGQLLDRVQVGVATLRQHQPKRDRYDSDDGDGRTESWKVV